MRIQLVAAAACLLVGTAAAQATPMTETIGTVVVDGTNYTVSVLGDASGNQSFDELSPTITFTTLATATDAGNALLAEFGTAFEWNPIAGTFGGRIAYANDGTNYSYLTLCCGGLNGPFISFPDDEANAFSFIEFAPVSSVSAPEPITLSLFGAGLLGAAAIRKRKSKPA